MKKAGFSFLLLIAVIANGQTPISNIEKYTTSHGLSSNRINTLLQDHRGFIWIATEWGLNRYDGRSFKQYTRTGPGQLAHYDIVSLAEDRAGNIWTGSYKGINRIDPLTETITGWSRSGYVCSDKEKNIWIIDQDSILLFDGKSIQQKFVLDVKPDLPNANSFISFLMEDSHQNLWLATSSGLRKLNKKTGTVTVYKAATEFANDPNACTMVYEDSNGEIWAGTWGEGILKVNEAKKTLEHYRFPHPYSNLIMGIHEIKLGKSSFLLLSTGGTNGGLLLMDKMNGDSPRIISKVMETATDKEPLSLNFSRILEDRQQNFWIASEDGLYKIDNNRQAFHWTYLPGIAQRDDVIFHSILSPINPDSVIYLSTIEGWWQLNPKTLSIHPHLLPRANQEMARFINNYVADKTGIWFTSQKGFGYYNLDKNTITDYSGIRGKDKPIYRSWGLVKDKLGRLWSSPYREGLLIFDPANGTTSQLFNDSSKNDLRGVSVSDLKIDQTGIIWMTTEGKLFRIDPITKAYTLFPIISNDGISRLHITAENKVLIWTERHIMEYRNNKIESVFSSEFIIRRFAEDAQGRFWLQTHNNFYMLSPALTQPVSFASGTGLNGNIQANELSFYGDYCVIVCKGKLLSFNSSGLDKQTMTAPVMLSSVSAGNKKYFFPGETSREIQLNFKNRLEIEISALNYSNEGDNRIFYKLEKWDDQWKELLTGSSLVYEQLPPGDYTFLAKASNAGRELGTQPVTLHFNIRPPFWKTWWFISLAVLLVTLTVYWLYRYRLAQAIKMERLRMRIATDLHDDIGATLSSISMYSEAVKKQVKDQLPQLEPVLEKMGENSRNMVSSMNDIVWAVNPGNDHGEKLLERMESYARDACAVANSKLHFKCNDELRNLRFSPEHRKNIYLVFKEALNNALKYAEAGNIWVTINKKSSQYQLSIKDDGKGFDTRNGSAGNGLKNMRARAVEINAEIKIISALEEGTTIELAGKIS